MVFSWPSVPMRSISPQNRPQAWRRPYACPRRARHGLRSCACELSRAERQSVHLICGWSTRGTAYKNMRLETLGLAAWGPTTCRRRSNTGVVACILDEKVVSRTPNPFLTLHIGERNVRPEFGKASTDARKLPSVVWTSRVSTRSGSGEPYF